MQTQIDPIREALNPSAVRERLARAESEAEVLRRLLRVAEFADRELPEQREAANAS
jgi:hypothetical protein